jgi:hypothetical protein
LAYQDITDLLALNSQPDCLSLSLEDMFHQDFAGGFLQGEYPFAAIMGLAREPTSSEADYNECSHKRHRAGYDPIVQIYYRE